MYAKRIPCGKARSSGAINVRKAEEGLIHTTKWKNRERQWKTANLIVVFTFDKGVISCEQYHFKLTGKTFAEFVKELHFSSAFSNCANPRGKPAFFQDFFGDSRQCSKVAHKAIDR